MNTQHEMVVSIISSSYIDELKDVLTSNMEVADMAEFIVELVNNVTKEVKQGYTKDGIL